MTAVTLVVSVGGSPEAVEVSIAAHRPASVIFFSSPESSQHIGEVRRRLKERGIAFDHRNVVADDAEDFDGCFARVLDMESCLPNGPDVIVDPTGGTKIMTGALTLGSHRWKRAVRYAYVGGHERTKDGLGVVQTGCERVRTFESPIRRNGLDALDRFATYFDQHRFRAAGEMAAHAASVVGDRERGLFNVLQDAAHGFDQWDRFDHAKAFAVIGRFIREVKVHASYRPDDARLRRLVEGARSGQAFLDAVRTDGWRRPTHRLVADLVANAARRADEDRLDDAVARLYRAVEMRLQVALFERFQVPSSAVPLEVVPEGLVQEYERRYRDNETGNLRLPLYALSKLLHQCGDEFGVRFEAERQSLRSLMEARNSSILAHGQAPASRQTYESMRSLAEVLLLTPGFEAPSFPKLG